MSLSRDDDPVRAPFAPVVVPLTTEQADALRDLAARVDRLAPSHRDPERFFVDRSELAHELRALAAAAEATGGR